MKKLLTPILLLLTICFLISCDKDDENSSGSLTGTWKMTDIHADDGVNTTFVGFLGQEIIYTYTFHGKDYATTTTFTENPNEFTSQGSYTVVTTVDLAGSITTTENPVNAFAGTGTWSINGNTLTQDFGGQVSEFEILEFTKSKLRIKEDLDVEFDDNGNHVHNTATVYSTFEKQ